MPQINTGPMTEVQLLEAVRDEAGKAFGSTETQSITERVKNMKYYLGEKTGALKQPRGRSGVLSRDVLEAVEWIMPDLMAVLAAKEDTVVRFGARKKKDIPWSQEATDYVPYIVHTRNPGHVLFQTWFRDALISKLGVLKYYWSPVAGTRHEKYNGLLPKEAEALLADSPNMDPIGVEQLSDGKVNVRMRVKDNDGEIIIVAVPPEEFRYNTDATSLATARFQGQVSMKSKSELIDEGFDRELVETLKYGNQNLKVTEDKSTRLPDDPQFQPMLKQSKQAEVWETYYRVDFDGDGYAELRQVIYSDRTILSNEEVDHPPYAALSPILQSHKVAGISLADLMRELQEIKTALMRNILDNAYLRNNGRWAVVKDQVNIEDVLDGQPGGIIRQNAPGMVEPIAIPNLDPSTFSLLQYLDSVREDRAGVGKINNGMDRNAISSNVAAGAVEKVMTAAEKRVELIARTFAETGIKDLYLGVLRLSKQFPQQETVIRLRGDLVEVNPAQYHDNVDLEIHLGLGPNDKQMRLLSLANLRTMMAEVVSAGGLGSIVQPVNVYNMAQEVTRLSGFPELADVIWSDPRLEENQLEDEPSETELKIQFEEKKLAQDKEFKVAEQAIEGRKIKLEEAEHALKEKEFNWRRIVETAELGLEAKQERPVGLGKN